MEVRRFHRKRTRGVLATLTLVSLLLITAGPARGHTSESDSLFQENTGDLGNHAVWTDPNWSGIPCGTQLGSIHYVLTHLVVFGSNSAYVTVGSQKLKTSNGDGTCNSVHEYFWARFYNQGFVMGEISSPTPPGTHDFALNQLTTGCATGIAWCWHIRIDGNTKHTTAGEVTDLALGLAFTLDTECNVHGSPAECQASGLIDTAHDLTIKRLNGQWEPWAGKDYECSDYATKARAKWASATSIKAGYNVTLSGAIQGDQCQ